MAQLFAECMDEKCPFKLVRDLPTGGDEDIEETFYNECEEHRRTTKHRVYTDIREHYEPGH